ncbi:MAG: YhcH/YjgK/YiaL family protein [Clostridia bacterium]|nr:YhcH/YjgK/YiaL family protein [Clostridia bacterium]
MIYDNVKNKERYRAIPWLYAALSDLEQYQEPGAYPRAGKDRAVVSAYDTVKTDLARLENHHDYIDVQVVLSGREKFGVADVSLCEPSVAYDPVKDVEFYRAPEDKIDVLHLGAGDFAVVWPGETHSPGIVDGTSEAVKKVVFKVLA